MKTIYTAEQLKSVYGEPKNVAPVQQEQEEQKDGFLKSLAKDVAGTLVVNPITRATSAITQAVAPESMAAKGFQEFQDTGADQKVLGIDVPAVKAFGDGGGKQIAGEALKTASYLFPYGKVAGVAGKTLGKIGGNVASGATGGYAADVGYGLTEGESIGEAMTPGVGTAIGAAIPLAGPALRATGRATAKLGGKAVESVIPVSTREAGILQTYKANNPFFKRVADVLKGTEKAPTTAGKTATTQGLLGTKSGIGVQATRASQKLWDDVISPRLKQSNQAVDLDGFFNKIQDDIIKANPEASRQKALLNALQSFKDDYAGINSVSLEKLQKLKEGWAEFIPEKAYRGENISGAANQVRKLMANESRQTIYSQLGDDVKQAYFDYGNLQGLKKLGQTSMTGQKLKGGTGGLVSEIFSQAITPIGTVGGQAVYKLGKGIEFVGNLGAKNLGEALGVNLKFPGDMAVDDISKSLKKTQVKSLPTITQIPQTIKKPIKTSNISTNNTTQGLKVNTETNLINEARKYKSAEEFVKAQPKLYHGGSADIKDIQLGKSNFQKTFYMSENPDYAKSFGGNKSSLNEIMVDSKAKLADLRKPSDDLVKQIEDIISSKPTGKTVRIQKPDGTFLEIPETKGGLSNPVHSSKDILNGIRQGKAYFAEMPEVKNALKKLGYDGMITQESKMGTNFGVWNKDILKTKSQLTDIWKKANIKNKKQ